MKRRPDRVTETKRIVREDRALLDRLATSDGTDNDGTNDGTKQG